MSKDSRKSDVSTTAITAVVAIVATLLGGLFTYVATGRQVSGQNTVARVDFMRSQRQVAYSNLIADMDAWLKATDKIVIDKSPTLALAIADADSKSETDAAAKYMTDTTTVQVIGSNEAVRNAKNFSAAENQINFDLARFSEAINDFHPSRTPAEATYEKDYPVPYMYKVAFITTARRDLGATS